MCMSQKSRDGWIPIRNQPANSSLKSLKPLAGSIFDLLVIKFSGIPLFSESSSLGPAKNSIVVVVDDWLSYGYGY